MDNITVVIVCFKNFKKQLRSELVAFQKALEVQQEEIGNEISVHDTYAKE